MTHTHSHSHAHVHAAAGPQNLNRAFAVGIGLNVLFVTLEAGYGIWAGSLALISDAGHNLSDVLGLLLAWGAALLAARKPTERRTYGYRRATILASLASALILVMALGAIVLEAVRRMWDPAPVPGQIIIVVAGIGVVINTVTALLFASGRRGDLNIRGAFLHMAADAAVSFGVVAAGAVIWFTGWFWVDPAVSLTVVAIIFAGTWQLLRESFNLAVDAVPEHIATDEVRRYLTGLEEVVRIHDLHIWAMSTTEVALTVHLVVTDPVQREDFLEEVSQTLSRQFGIGHTTLQVETLDREDACRRYGACDL